jgi:hypothetical protein
MHIQTNRKGRSNLHVGVFAHSSVPGDARQRSIDMRTHLYYIQPLKMHCKHDVGSEKVESTSLMSLRA